MAFLSRNPHTGATLRKVAFSQRNVIESTITRLNSKFTSMKSDGQQERWNQLNLIQSVIKDKHDDIAEMLSQESGKSLWLSKGEIQSVINNFEWFKENLNEILKPEMRGNSILTSANVVKQGIHLNPLGIIYQISPFNFPFGISMNSTAKNIAMGNTVLCRPDKGSIHALGYFQPLLQEAGVTAQEYVYSGEDDLEFIIGNDAIQGVCFTGSSEVGKHIHGVASKYMKKSLIELGGCDPFVVLEDADLDLAVEKAFFWRTFHAGQVCVSPKRMIVSDKLIDEFTNRIVEKAKNVKVGVDPITHSEPGTGFPPMSRLDLRSKVHDQVQRSVKSGDTLLAGGNEVGETYYEPTVLRVKSSDSPAWREEIFGPVFAIRGFSTETDALAMANDTEWGLSGSVYSKDLDRGLKFANGINSGMVHVNDTVPSDDPILQFGGNKKSGMGRNHYKYFTNEQSFIVHQE